jgi:predicted DNA-binding ribbon-helix-helix protein
MTSDEGEPKEGWIDSLLSPDAADIRKRSVVIAGHRTSVSVENAFWQALLDIAVERGMSANQLVTEIDRRREGNLSSAIRLFVLSEIAKGR